MENKKKINIDKEKQIKVKVLFSNTKIADKIYQKDDELMVDSYKGLEIFTKRI